MTTAEALDNYFDKKQFYKEGVSRLRALLKITALS